MKSFETIFKKNIWSILLLVIVIFCRSNSVGELGPFAGRFSSRPSLDPQLDPRPSHSASASASPVKIPNFIAALPPAGHVFPLGVGGPTTARRRMARVDPDPEQNDFRWGILSPPLTLQKKKIRSRSGRAAAAYDYEATRRRRSTAPMSSSRRVERGFGGEATLLLTFLREIKNVPPPSPV